MFLSRASAYTNVQMMDTKAHIYFQNELQDQWVTAQAAADLKNNSQISQMGGGGSLGATRGWAGMPWYTISSLLYAFAPWVIVICGILSGVIYALKGTQMMMFFTLFLTLFFLLFFVLFITASQRAGILTGRNFFVSFFSSLLGAGVVAFGLYEPDSKKEQPVPIYPNPSNENNVPAYTW